MTNGHVISSVTPHIEGVGRVMLTNNGNHPPEFWAQITAEHIVRVDNLTGRRRNAALVLQAKVMEALEPHHARVQADEDSSPENMNSLATPEGYVEGALKSIQDAAKGSEWESEFTFGKTEPVWLKEYEALVDRVGADNVLLHRAPLTPEQIAEERQWKRQEVIRFEVARHFASSQLTSKAWHRDIAAEKGAN